MNEPIRARIASFCGQKRVLAGSLIISLFGDMVLPRGGRIWMGSLIRLLEPLGLNERLARTAVFRLARDQWLCSAAHGRRSDYLLTPAGQRRCEEAARQIYAARGPDWDRRWRLLLVLAPLAQKDRDGLRRALFWQGFGALGEQCFVHPGVDLSVVLDTLAAEGKGRWLADLLPLVAADASLAGMAGNADLVARAWDLRGLARAYGDFVALYAPVLAELRADRQVAIDDEEVCLLRLLLIHDYRRLLLRDPELPEVLLPVDWPGEQARVLCKELYRRLLAPSERHLDRLLCTADGRSPTFSPAFLARFQPDDPLPIPERRSMR